MPGDVAPRFADASGTPLATAGGTLLVLPTRNGPPHRPPAPPDLSLSEGVLSWASAGEDVARYRVWESREERRGRTLLGETTALSYDVPTTGDDEKPSYQVSAVSDFTGAEGPRCRPVFAAGPNRR